MSFDAAIPLIRAAAGPGEAAADRFDGLEPFAAMIAAILDRQVGPSTWRPAIEALGDQGLLDPTRFHDAAMPEIQDALRGKAPAVSVRTLAPAKQLARWLVEQHEGRVDAISASGRSIDDLRGELAGIRGVGPAGADAILLAALGRPTYPVDRGTYRVLVRHGWLDAEATYDDARDAMVHRAGGDPVLLRELAAGMETLAARFCRASAPRCEACPLRGLLPEGGPIGVPE